MRRDKRSATRRCHSVVPVPEPARFGSAEPEQVGTEGIQHIRSNAALVYSRRRYYERKWRIKTGSNSGDRIETHVWRYSGRDGPRQFVNCRRSLNNREGAGMRQNQFGNSRGLPASEEVPLQLGRHFPPEGQRNMLIQSPKIGVTSERVVFAAIL